MTPPSLMCGCHMWKSPKIDQFLIKEKTAEQQVARMLDSSVEGISEAGSVAHVLALDALDAVKDVAKTRCVCVDQELSSAS